MRAVEWTRKGDEFFAYGQAPYEGEDGIELSDLYLEVRPSIDPEGEWDWNVSISMEDANFGSEVLESGTADSIELAQTECIEAALGVIGDEGYLS